VLLALTDLLPALPIFFIPASALTSNFSMQREHSMQVRAAIGEVFNVQIRVALGTNLRKSKEKGPAGQFMTLFISIRDCLRSYLH